MSTYNKEYYAQRREQILASRRERYKNDPAYREAVRMARQRSTLRELETRAKRPENYVADLAMVLEDLEITVWRFREWLKNSYIPQPVIFGKKFWFTSTQVFLLQKLSAFFGTTGKRLTRRERAALQLLTDEIIVNWTNEN